MNYYIHIPFCRSKCKYCHFASFSGIDEIKKAKYLDFLKKEISENLSKNTNKNIGSIYFGGGTPSILNLDELKGILECFGVDTFDSTSFRSVGRNREITLEVNPEFITEDYIVGLKELGINRISLGIQTLNDISLEEIGRCSTEKIFTALDILEDLNFPNVGIDFIIGLPFVGRGDSKKDIEKLLNKYSVIKHVSVYILEEGKYPENWKNNSLKDEVLGGEYEEVANFLEKKGFIRYELSNFSLPGYECKHNSGYWNHTEYVGFGLSAASFIDKRRFSNSSNFVGYYMSKLDFEENLSEEDLELEKLMFEFRTIGIEEKFIKNIYKLEEFKIDKLIIGINTLIKPANKGIIIVDYLFKELFL